MRIRFRALILLVGLAHSIDGFSSIRSSNEPISSIRPQFSDTHSLNRELHALAKLKDHRAAEKAHDLLKHAESSVLSNDLSCVPDTYSYTSVIDAWAGIRQSEKTTEILMYMNEITDDKRNMKPNTVACNLVINSFKGDADGGDKAEALLEQMRDDYNTGRNKYCSPDTISYNSVMNVWAHSGRKDAGEKAELVLDSLWKMHSILKTDDNKSILVPDQFSYSTVISAWARSGSGQYAAEKSEKVLDQMNQYYQSGYKKLYPTTYVVNAVLNAWAKSKGRQAIQRIEALVLRMEQLSKKNHPELQPNIISYNTIIGAYAELGEAKQAQKSLRRVENYSFVIPDEISYYSVISAWTRNKNKLLGAQKALAILKHMEQRCENNSSAISPTNVGYATVINAFAQCGEAEMAESILNFMDSAYQKGNKNLKPTILSFNTVCNAFAKSQSRDAADRAMVILERMKKGKYQPDIITYTSVLDALSKQGTEESAEKALDLLQSLEREYDATKNTKIKPNIRTYTSVVNAISRSKLEPRRAHDMMDHIEDMNRKSSHQEIKLDVVCYNAVINAWGWSEEPDKAIMANSILERMLERYVDGNKDAKPDLITLNSLLNACAFTKHKDIERAAATVHIAVSAFKVFEEEGFDSPNHLAYGSLLMVVNKLVANDDVRTEYIKKIFHKCCQKGHFSGYVARQLKHGISSVILKELLGSAIVPNKSKEIHIDKRRVPKKWCRNEFGVKSRSRPSKKRSLTRVSITKHRPETILVER
jgi:hypothetical protein